MEFWGVEVKNGQVLSISPPDDTYIHISQVACIDAPPSNERIGVYVHSDDKKLAVGSIYPGKAEQFSLDVVFSKPFKLSHSGAKGTVSFVGYSTPTEMDISDSDDEMDSDEEDSEEEEALGLTEAKENGQKQPAAIKAAVKAKPEAVKADAKKDAEKKNKLKPVEESSDDEDEDEDDDDAMDEDEDEDEEGSSEEDDEDDSDDEEDSEESEEEKEATPKSQDSKKKRPVPDSGVKTPATDKKSKLNTGTAQKIALTPIKADASGKKGQTPKPTKEVSTPKAAATPGTGKKLSAEISCNSCSKKFSSDAALTQHKTAKHSAK